MAKKTKSRALALRPTARPTIIKMPAPKIIKPKRHHRRHHGHGGGMGGLMSKTRMGMVAGAFAVGILEKQGFMQSLPKLPVIGGIGTIGVAAYLLSDHGRNHLADNIATAAFMLAAHELASTGTIVGGEAQPPQDVGYVAGW